MKFSIDIDCTPSEAREFFGLPDVEAFNQALVEKAQEKVFANMQDMDPEGTGNSIRKGTVVREFDGGPAFR